MACYDKIARIVRPKQDMLDQANDLLDETNNALDIKRDELKVIEKDLLALEKKKKKSIQKLNTYKEDEELCRVKLIRAEEILLSLGNEKDRWRSEVDYCTECESKLAGDVLIATALIVYTGQYNAFHREVLRDKWVSRLKKDKIACTLSTMDRPNKILAQVLGSSVVLRQWKDQGLPRDVYSEETAMMVQHSGKKFPLFIDPQEQAQHWITAMEQQRCSSSSSAAAFLTLRPSDKNILSTLTTAAYHGHHVLLEHIDQTLDQALLPFLQPRTRRRKTVSPTPSNHHKQPLYEHVVALPPYHATTVEGVVDVGDAECDAECNADFFLYLFTTNADIHCHPDMLSKINVLNFTMTVEGTVEVLLGKGTLLLQACPGI